LALIWLINIGNGVSLNYPPTLEQINIGGQNLWLVRVISLGLVLVGLKILYGYVVDILGEKVAYFSILLISISPVISTLWINHPIESGLMMAIVGGMAKLKDKKWGWVLVGTLLLGLNLIRFKDASPIVSVTKISEIQMDVGKRVMEEDVLTYRNDLPLAIRRISYNKVVFLGMRLMRTIVPFFDIDSIFFSEIHPTNDKTMVIFFWPAAILFLVGVYKLLNLKEKKGKYILGLILVSLFYFVSKEGAVSERLIWTVIPLSMICAAGLVEVGWWKCLVGSLMLYGFVSNWNDMKLRAGYWFDNRPMAMEFFFKDNREINGPVFVSNKLDGSAEYCKYYNDNCENVNLVGFDLSSGEIAKGTYIGFVGEFVGKNISNNFGDDWTTKIEDRGLKILSAKRMDNSIAHQYGDYLVKAQK